MSLTSLVSGFGREKLVFTYTYKMFLCHGNNTLEFLIWVVFLFKLEYITIIAVDVVGVGIFVMFTPDLSFLCWISGMNTRGLLSFLNLFFRILML